MPLNYPSRASDAYGVRLTALKTIDEEPRTVVEGDKIHNSSSPEQIFNTYPEKATVRATRATPGRGVTC